MTRLIFALPAFVVGFVTGLLVVKPRTRPENIPVLIVPSLAALGLRRRVS
jgi:hypothetical protein